MRVGKLHPATIHHIKMLQHYTRLMAEKRIIDNLEDNRKRENARRVHEADKGKYVDIMV